MSTSKAKTGSRQLSPLPIVDGVILFKRVCLYKGTSLCITLIFLHGSMDAYGSSSDVCACLQLLHQSLNATENK